MEHDITLTDGPVTLNPLSERDGPRLLAVVDRESWNGMSTPLPATGEEMSRQLATLIEMDGAMAFAVEYQGRFVGRTLLYDHVPDLRVEIGNTIYDRAVWGSVVNPTAKLLLLTYAFDTLGVGRVGLRCDSRNTRSHNAIRRLGATFEGTLRWFRPAADGSVADVDYFSILTSERDAVCDRLRDRIGSMTN